MKHALTTSLFAILLFAFTGCNQYTDGILDNICDNGNGSSGGNPICSVTEIELPSANVKVKKIGWGETPCIVFASHKMYPRVISPTLYDDFTFYFTDARWFGEVTDPNILQNSSIDAISMDIELVRQELGLGKVAIMGHSIHGAYAMEYARRYPENTSHVIGIGSPAAGLIATMGYAPTFWEENASAERKQQMIDNMTAFEALDKSGMEPHEIFTLQYVYEAPKYWADYTYDCSWIWRGVTFDMNQVNNTVYGNFLTFDPSGIEVPMFVAMGKHDYAIPYTMWEQIEAAGTCNNLTVSYFDNSGHYPMFEEAELFGDILTDWIEENE